MKIYDAKDIRNVCFVGSQGTGKTSIAEALLFNAGVTNRLGNVSDGNTVCDYTEEEIERKISINLSLAFYEDTNTKINLLTTPGYADFVGDIHEGVSIAENTIFVFDADKGVRPSGENIWEILEDKKSPVCVFLNKLDKDNLDFEGIIKSAKEKLNNQVVAISVPNETGANFSSVINLLGKDVPADKASSRDALMEAISSVDDTLTEKYLEGKEITDDELKGALKKAIKERKIFPVLCGSASKNIGIKELSVFIVDYLSEPDTSKDDGKFKALAFKTLSEPGTGQVNFVKIYSGEVSAGKDIYNFTKSLKERIGQMCCVQGKKKIDTQGAKAGDIVALPKLKETRTNDVIAEGKDDPCITQIAFPEAIYERAISAKSKGEEEKVGHALSALTMENPTIHHHFNSETKQMVVSGMGALQLEIMVHKIKTRYGVEVDLKPTRIPYRETIRGRAEVQGKYKKQSGGRGQYGDCHLKIEPLERGKGFEFVNKIVGGAIPKNYIPAIEKGVKEAMQNGIIAGYEAVDVKVTVYDGSYHDVDSSDMAFKIAGAMALRKGFTQSKPIILEPIINIDVTVPDEYMGTVMGDLNSRRGRVLGMDKKGKKELIKSQIPLGEISSYATDLRSLTKGSGKFMIKPSHYEEAPPQVTQPLIDEYQKMRAHEEEK